MEANLRNIAEAAGGDKLFVKGDRILKSDRNGGNYSLDEMVMVKLVGDMVHVVGDRWPTGFGMWMVGPCMQIEIDFYHVES